MSWSLGWRERQSELLLCAHTSVASFHIPGYKPFLGTRPGHAGVQDHPEAEDGGKSALESGGAFNVCEVFHAQWLF